MNDIFAQALKNENHSGSYILHGSSPEAVRRDMDEFLLHVFCDEKRACRTCPGCKKYLHTSHVDILSITSKGKTIKIDEVRNIPGWLANKAYEGGARAVILQGADSMTEQAQNALLKVLEEPPTGTVFLLTASNIRNLLPTIVSRCIILKTQNDVHGATEKLMEELSLPTIKAAVLAKFANGDFHLAKEYFERGFFEMRDDAVIVLGKLFSAKNMAISAMMALLLKHEQEVFLMLDMMLVYISDVLKIKHMGSKEIINDDKYHEAAGHAKLRDFVLINTMDSIHELITKKQQCAGLYMKLALEKMLFSILEVIT